MFREGLMDFLHYDSKKYRGTRQDKNGKRTKKVTQFKYPEIKDTHRYYRYTQTPQIHTDTKDAHRHHRYIQTPKIHIDTKNTYRYHRFIQTPKIHTDTTHAH